MAKTRTTGKPRKTKKLTADSDSQDTGEAILAMMEEIWRLIPDEEMDKLPTDLAEQHDHYIYGLPKRDS